MDEPENTPVAFTFHSSEGGGDFLRMPAGKSRSQAVLTFTTREKAEAFQAAENVPDRYEIVGFCTKEDVFAWLREMVRLGQLTVAPDPIDNGWATMEIRQYLQLADKGGQP